MDPKELLKAGASLSGHLKECAKVHKSASESHDDIAKAHAAASEDAEGSAAKCHKACAKAHEKISKAHAAFAEKCEGMAAKMDEAAKAAEAETLAKGATTPAAGAETPAAAATTPAAAAGDPKPEAVVGDEIQKGVVSLMKEQLGELLKSDEVKQMFRNAAAKQLEEALGNTLAPIPGKKAAAAGEDPAAKTTTEVPRFAEGLKKSPLVQSESETGL